MLIKKLLLVIFCIALGAKIFAQTAPDDKQPLSDVPAETQEKAVKLLNNLASEAEQFSVPSNRISARIRVSELLWATDEKPARVIVQNAVSELSQMLSQIPAEISETDEEENLKRYTLLADVKSLRSELLLMLAERDPQLALETLQLLTRKTADGASFFEDDQALELSLAAQIAGKNPKKAYELAKKNLENGLNYNLFATLEDLYQKDSELGTKLAQDISSKIKSKDTTVNSPYDAPAANASNTTTNTRLAANKTGGLVVNTWEIQMFLDSIKKLNRQASKNKKANALTDNEMKEVLDVLIQKYLRQQYLSPYEISKIMPEINRYFPAQAQAIRAKIGQNESATLNNLVNSQTFQDETEGKSPDEIAQMIEKKPGGEKDDLYWAAAQKAFTEGAVQDAKKFYAKIKTKREYDYLDKQIDNALPLAVAENGDLSQVRQMLGKVKTPEERIGILTALATTVANKGDAKTAAALLEEARSMYSGKMKNRKNLSSILQFAQAFAVVEPDQSFSFLESNVNYFNEIIGAAILLNEFNEYGAVVNEELRLDTVESESYRNAPNAVRLIKKLAERDFERLVGFADKFSRAEVRFFVRYRVADALLNPSAEDDEKTSQTNTGEEGYEH